MVSSRCIIVFFFKQKTAYEMRISDWSSDVCSADLIHQRPAARAMDGKERADRGGQGSEPHVAINHTLARPVEVGHRFQGRLPRGGISVEPAAGGHRDHGLPAPRSGLRSEKRRGGKECVSQYSYRG